MYCLFDIIYVHTYIHAYDVDVLEEFAIQFGEKESEEEIKMNN